MNYLECKRKMASRLRRGKMFCFFLHDLPCFLQSFSRLKFFNLYLLLKLAIELAYWKFHVNNVENIPANIATMSFGNGRAFFLNFIALVEGNERQLSKASTEKEKAKASLLNFFRGHQSYLVFLPAFCW